MARGAPERVDVDELARTSPHPVLRHAVSTATHDAAWVRGAAALVHGPTHTMVLGPAADVGPLLRALGDVVRPVRLSVEEASYAVVPDAWAYRPQGHWHWMRSLGRPDPADPGPGVEVVEVTDPAAVDAVLDVANPASHARPGTPGIEGWLGVRLDGRLVGVGAVRRDPDGSGHLRGVSVLPEVAGRGLGTTLSLALTRRAADRPPGVATLGVYVDNAPALRIYDRLGYVVEHTFLSGAPRARPGA